MNLIPTVIEKSGPRERIYDNLVRQERKKLQYARTLQNFADRILDLLNSRYEGIRFTIEKEPEVF